MREFDLLAHVYRANAALPQGVTIPPGDDMGAVRIAGRDVLVTVDQLAAGVHVDLTTTSLKRVGRKAITRNLSDVAAMAATPRAAVAAVTLPRDFGEAHARTLFEAMRETADAFDCPLVGGDIAMWDHSMLASVTVLADADGIEPVLRKGARPGDGIYLTGTVGGSLEQLPTGYAHHLDFTPRLATARALAENTQTRPTAMIDVSDGVARDLGHLCHAAGLGAIVNVETLPLSRGATQAAARTGRPAWAHALTDGEDYELLFTAAMGTMPADVDDVPITCIGQMDAAGGTRNAGAGVRLRLPDGQMVGVDAVGGPGWEHAG